MFDFQLRTDVIDAAVNGAMIQAQRNGTDLGHPEVRRAFARLRAKLDQLTVRVRVVVEESPK